MSLKKPVVFETTFSTFVSSRIIGQGSSGRVYEAVDEDGGRWAIKLLNAESTSKEKLNRFKNELTFCTNNTHSNIVTVVDHGLLKLGGKSAPFFVMPIYPSSLRPLIRESISKEKVLPYFLQLLDGVEAAHLKGVVHRDLKPENVLYDGPNDGLIVGDFGINAKWMESLSNISGFHSVPESGPAQFTITEDGVAVGVPANRAQDVVDYFKEWIPLATKVYETRLRLELKKEQ